MVYALKRTELKRSTEPMARARMKKRRRKPKPGDDPKYLVWVRTLPCLVCQFSGLHQETRTEAAHLGLSESRRGIGQKYPDAEAGPLCQWHHVSGSDAIHRLGPAWWLHHGIDRDSTLLALQELYASRALSHGVSLPRTS